MPLGELPPNPLLGTLRPPQTPAVMIDLSEIKSFDSISRLLIILLKRETRSIVAEVRASLVDYIQESELK